MTVIPWAIIAGVVILLVAGAIVISAIKHIPRVDTPFETFDDDCLFDGYKN